MRPRLGFFRASRAPPNSPPPTPPPGPVPASPSLPCATRPPTSLLPRALAALPPGGALSVLAPVADAAAVTLDLVLAGFVGVTTSATDATGSTTVTGAKPSWAVGSAAPLKRGAAAAAAPPEDDLVDENALLAVDGGGGATASAGGCAPTRAACANCSCGRKEEQEAAAASGGAGGVPVVAPAAPAPKSSCGNCAKGDAFRCAGCPYLGKPAFREGTDGAMLLNLEQDA